MQRYETYFMLSSTKNTKDLYEKYIKYHGYSGSDFCEVANNMSIYYFNLEDFNNSAKHVNLAYEKAEKNNPKCLNPTLLKILKEKKLISP